MATNVRLEDVDEALLREAKMQAVAAGLTLKAWILGLMVQAVRGGEKQGAQVSPEARSSLQRLPSARLQGESRASRPRKGKQVVLRQVAEAVREESETHTTVEPCRHGLLFHPGCNA